MSNLPRPFFQSFRRLGRNWFKRTKPTYLNNKPSFEFTVASYNVLADQLLNDHPHLYFSRGTPEPWIFDWNYRKKNLLAEIAYSYADREVDPTSQSSTKIGDKRWRAPKGAYKDKYLKSNDIYVSSMLIVFILSNGHHPFLSDKEYVTSRENDLLEEKFKQKLLIRNQRDGIQISSDVREHLNATFKEYYKLIVDENAQGEHLDIKSFKKSYEELYSVKYPDHTQGLRYMMFIRFDYQT